MTTVLLPNVGVTAGYQLGDSGWSTSMNKNLRLLDALMQPTVPDKDEGTPPGTPVDNRLYLVGASPSGAWGGNTNNLAVFQVGDDLTSAWLFITPKEGWRVWVEDENTYYRFDGSAWAIEESGGGSAGLTWREQTASYTLVLGDANNGVAIDAAGANTVTVPPNSDEAFPIGTSILILQEGAGLTTVAAGSGVTIQKRGSSLALAGQWAMATVVKRDTDLWILSGDITA